jgi:hypothetical protein
MRWTICILSAGNGQGSKPGVDILCKVGDPNLLFFSPPFISGNKPGENQRFKYYSDFIDQRINRWRGYGYILNNLDQRRVHDLRWIALANDLCS